MTPFNHLSAAAQLSMGHARALAWDRVRSIAYAWPGVAVEQDLSVRTIERQVQLLRAGTPPDQVQRKFGRTYKQLEERFTQVLGSQGEDQRGPQGQERPGRDLLSDPG